MLLAKSPGFSSEKELFEVLASANAKKLDYYLGERILFWSCSSLQRNLRRLTGSDVLALIGREDL